MLDAEIARDREEREPVLAGVGANQHHGIGTMGIPAARLGAAVGPENEDRGGGRGEQSVLGLQLACDGGRHARIRILDALRDGEVARHAPDHAEHEEDHEREQHPPSHATLAGRRRGAACAGFLGTVGCGALQRDLALRPTALVHPVGLLLFGHPGGYRSRDVGEERVIGVDLGGTKILAGLVARDGTIGRTIEIATPDGTQAEVLEAIDDVVADLLEDGAAAIGYGVPLNIDRRTGVALRAVNLPLHQVHFPDRARERFGLPAGVENDGNAAALAEWRLGAGTGCVGPDHAHARNRRRWRRRDRRSPLPRLGRARARRRRRGRSALPGELSRARAPRGSCVRACGGPGGGAASSGLTPTRRCSSSGPRAGDAAAVDALAEIGRLLGAAIGSLANIFDPDVVIIGGGFGAAAGDLVLGPARIAARAEAIQPADETLQIVEAELGDEAGLIGAALVAYEALDGVR